MKSLKEIIDQIAVEKIIGKEDREIKKIIFDSREAEPGSLFVAVKGTQTDGHKFIVTAEKAGADVVVCEEYPILPSNSVTYIIVKDSSLALGIMASNFFDKPSSKLKLVGITGTNGKTTVATLLYNLYTGLGYKTGLISTVQNKINQDIIPSTHTTPNPIAINQLLHDMVNKGCEYCFMEVSSHAIVQKRIAGLQFVGGAFTNITHDHLDFHGDFKNYITAKKTFFDQLPANAFALTNIDDKNGAVMLQNTAAKKKTYALKQMADYSGRVIENNFSGLFLEINKINAYFKLIGNFNAYNLTCVFGIAELLGSNINEVLVVMSQLEGAEGRFDYTVSPSGIIGIVDYAHTPDALENVINTINEIKSNGNIICILGCGGNRDKSKRNVMGKISVRNCNTTIFTSDNPRDENPEDIIADMEAGMGTAEYRRFFVIIDRKEAIRSAVHLARPGDIVLVAGKGHEKYQEIKGVKHPFDDKKILTEFLNLIG